MLHSTLICDFLEPALPDYAVFIARCILFGITHSLFAANWTKQAFCSVCGREPRSYRLLYNLFSLAMFAWVMSAYRTSSLIYAAHGIWRWLLYTAQLVIVAIILQCVRQTGAGDFLGISQLRPSTVQAQSLFTSGWYACVRHPIYLFSTLFLALNPVMTVQWLLLTIFSVAYFIAGGILEERRLLKKFGEEYRMYQQKVPFMIPCLKRNRRM